MKVSVKEIDSQENELMVLLDGIETNIRLSKPFSDWRLEVDSEDFGWFETIQTAMDAVYQIPMQNIKLKPDRKHGVKSANLKK